MPRSPTSDGGRDDPLATFLRELDPDELVELVLAAAATSDELAGRLHAAMARSTGDVTQLKLEVRRRLPARRYLDWRGSNEYARTAVEVASLLTDLVDGGQATASIALIEDAFGRINKLLLHADDSSGMLGDIARSLLALHVRACAEGSPDPRKLVKWLIAVGVDDKGGFFNPVVDDYATALGPAGLAAYRKIIDERWQAGDRRFALMYAKRGLARIDRDVAALVETTHPDAPTGTHLTEVARELFKIGMREEGLAFAERAIAARPFMNQGDTAYDLAAAEYLRRGDTAEALRLLHEALRRAPTPPRYAVLRRLAEQVGAWPAEQAAARATVAGEINVLVTVMLDDGDVDAAWATGQGQPLWTSLRERLARERAVEHPGDAIPALEELVYLELGPADVRAYRAGVKRLRELAQLCDRTGEDERFAQLITDLRSEFAPPPDVPARARPRRVR